MPRPNRGRTVHGEEQVARTIARLREERGWTYEGLAKRMTDVGCPLASSAIYKIEKQSPRRRITVDELVAFAAVFNLGVEDLIGRPDAREAAAEVVLARIDREAEEIRMAIVPRLIDYFHELEAALDASPQSARLAEELWHRDYADLDANDDMREYGAAVNAFVRRILGRVVRDRRMTNLRRGGLEAPTEGTP